MRVLFVTPYYRPAHLGGIERAIERLAAALYVGGHVEQLGVLTTHYAFPPRYISRLPSNEVLNDGLVVYRLSACPRTPAPLFPLYSCPVTYFSPREIRQVIRSFRPDVVHLVGDGWVWTHLWLLAVRSAGAAMVFTPSFHDLTGSRAWLRLPNTLLADRVERVVVLTEHERHAVESAYHPRRARVSVVPWGVTIPPFSSPIAVGRQGEKGVVTILCVGRLGEHKGQAWLLAAYLRARGEFQFPTRLIFVGADEGGPGGRATLSESIATAGVEQEVMLTGEVDDSTLERLYAGADIFALFSRYEAFGLVFVEALAHSVPVLTHRVGANATVLAQGGVLTAPYDADAACTALVTLVNSPTERLRLGDEGRAFVQASYSWDVVAVQYRQVYDAAVAERQRVPHLV